MHSAVLAAQAPEFDFGQVVVVIMLLLGGFFQWVANWWKQKQADAAKKRQPPPTPEELQARERAWREQTGAEESEPPMPEARNPLDELIETFRRLAAPETVAPPPIPRPQLPVAQTAPAVSVPIVAPTPVILPTVPTDIVKHRLRHPLAEKLAAIGGLRHAIVLREIIGPPKALQSTGDHLI